MSRAFVASGLLAVLLANNIFEADIDDIMLILLAMLFVVPIPEMGAWLGGQRRAALRRRRRNRGTIYE